MTGQKPEIRTQVPITLDGNVRVLTTTFNNLSDGKEHIALVFDRGNDPAGASLVRVHSSCVTGDIFGSQRCDCGDQLKDSIARLDKEGGVLVYLFQEGRGIGLKAKLDAYALQIEQGLDTFEANRALGHGDDERDYKSAAEILDALGVKSIALITNNPDKAVQLQSHGIEIVSLHPTRARVSDENRAYLVAKKSRGHTLNLE